jgi:NAD(P)H-dependent flavin oxidoreductase YrpB (nitropropane dioxygenase family)
MIWKTKINQITGTKYPLIMAAFARLGTIQFAAAFSNAGGLGIITALNYNIEEFESKLTEMKSLTKEPFGVNITVVPPGVSRSIGLLSERDYIKYVEVALNQGVKIFTTSAYQASFIGKRVHEAGGFWFHKCALLRHAISAEKVGADALTIIGLEATGFKNPYQHTTLVNMTLGKRILNVPLIAAGGIGDGRSFLSCLAMGADGVCLGTAIIPSVESPLDDLQKTMWLNTDILTTEYHDSLYHFSLSGTRVPSTAIAYHKSVKPVKQIIENIIFEAESVLKSWGFTKAELFNT